MNVNVNSIESRSCFDLFEMFFEVKKLGINKRKQSQHLYR